MNLTREQTTELEEAAKPLQEFFRKYLHPHCTISYDGDRIVVSEEITARLLPAHTD